MHDVCRRRFIVAWKQSKPNGSTNLSPASRNARPDISPVGRHGTPDWRQPGTAEWEPRTTHPRSSAVGGHVERPADLSHPRTAERADSFDEHSNRDRLHRVQVHRGATVDRIVVGFEDDLTWQTSDVRGARRNERTTQPRDGGVTREHNHRSATDLWWFTPPEFATLRRWVHVDAAASRNDARSPHSSSASIGWSR